MSGSGGSAAAVGIVLIVVAIGGILTYNIYVAPYFNRQPIKLPSVSEAVTFVTDAYGNAEAHVVQAFNATADYPYLTATATIHTNDTSIANLGLDASLVLYGGQFTIPQPNVQRGPDRTVFTWDITIASFSVAVLKVTADVIIRIVSCGQCSNTTFNIPVELALTLSG